MTEPRYPSYPGGGGADLGQPPIQPSNTLSTVSLVLSLVGLLVFVVFAIGGVIVGHVALGKIRRGEAVGAGPAKAGVVIGYIAIVLNLLFVAALLTDLLSWEDLGFGRTDGAGE